MEFESDESHERKFRVGDRVRQGQLIGQVGSSGRSSGPHLHLEIRKGYQAVNPLDYLP